VKALLRLLCGLAISTNLTHAAETIRVFDHEWTVINTADWKVDNENGVEVLRLLMPRGPIPNQPRRPQQFAIAETPDFNNVTIDVEVMPRRRSLIIVYNYRDATHFDYVHLSTDTGTKQPVHNGVFHVFGGERVRISSQAGPAAFPEKDRWYRVHLVQNGENGSVHAEVDGKAIPALHAVDLSLSSGRIGIGSFDEIGDFKNVKISSGSQSTGSN
jgi:hypothetical protein